MNSQKDKPIVIANLESRKLYLHNEVSCDLHVNEVSYDLDVIVKLNKKILEPITLYINENLSIVIKKCETPGSSKIRNLCFKIDDDFLERDKDE